MGQLSDVLQPDELARIKNLQVMAKQVVEGVITGMHRSPHKGFSVEFAQHRQYTHGDEIRRLDWKVFGKTDRLYVREYEEETNLRATVLLDMSGSMGYAGEGRKSKFEYAVRLTACLAYLLLQQRDSIGLVTFDTKMRRHIPPRSSTAHLRVLLDELAKSKTGGESDPGRVFHHLVPQLKRRGLVIIMSDAFGDVKQLVSALAHFRSARHEVLFLHILDPDEVEFPFEHWTRFESLEQKDVFRMVDPASFREAYLAKVAEFRDELKQGCARHRVDLEPMLTNQPFADALARFLARRQAV